MSKPPPESDNPRGGDGPGRARPRRFRPELDTAEMLAVARLGRAHGLRGEVLTLNLSPPCLEFPRLAAGRTFWTRGARPGAAGPLPKRLTPVSMRPHQGEFLITFEEIRDRSLAEACRGMELCLPREDLPPLPEGWFWEEDITGLQVRDETRGPLGVSAGLKALAGQDSLIVKLTAGGEILVPWVKALVTRVDMAAGLIETRLPRGYHGLPDEEESREE